MKLSLKKNLAKMVFIFFVITIFSNLVPNAAYADGTTEHIPFKTSLEINGQKIGNDSSLTLKNGDRVTFRVDFKCISGITKPGDKLTFTLPKLFSNIAIEHFPEICFNKPTVDGDTVTLVANKNIVNILGGYLTVQGTFKGDKDSGSVEIPIKINGNESKVTIHYENSTNGDKDNPDSGDGGSGKVTGGVLEKTVDGKHEVDVEKINSTNNIFHYKVEAKTLNMVEAGTFKDVMDQGLVLDKSSFKIVNALTGQDVTAKLEENTTLVSSVYGSSIVIKNLPIKEAYNITYTAYLDLNYMKDRHKLDINNNAYLGSAKASAVIYANTEETIDSQSQVDGLTQKWVMNGNDYSKIGQEKIYQIQTNYNNYELPAGTTIVDKLPIGLKFKQGGDLFRRVTAEGPRNTPPMGDVLVCIVNKDGGEKYVTVDGYGAQIAATINTPHVALLTVNYETQTLTLKITKANNNKYNIMYNTEISELVPSIENNAVTTVGDRHATAHAKIEFSSDAGAIGAKKLVNKETILPGENSNVQYTIEIFSYGIFPKQYLNIKDQLAKGIKLDSVVVPSGFSYKVKGDTVEVTNTENTVGTIKNPEVYKIYLNCSLADAKDGTTIDNTAYINNIPTNKVSTKKGYAFEAYKAATDNHKKMLEGAIYGVYNSSDKLLYKVTSGENGVMEGSLNNVGNYYLKELVAPKGYEISNKKIDFTITSEDIGTTIKIPTIYDNLAPKLGSLEVTKVNTDDQILKGAKFNLIQNGKVVDTATTNLNGVLEFKNLLPGKYELAEVQAPIGYKKILKNITVDVTAGKIENIKVTDEKEMGSLKITKTNESGTEKLQGATFAVTGPSYPRGIKVTTDKNGVANLDNLAWGTYTVQEIKAPTGYTVDGAKQTVIVNENTVGQAQGLTFKDKQVLGSLTITKTGKDGAKLAGAEFTITNKDVKDFKAIVGTTNGEGVVTFNNLPWGTYKVIETKAPIGYKLDSTSQTVTINAKNVESLKGLIFKDTKILGKLEITKTNESGTEKLQGATFTVTGPSYPKGTKVTTSKNGAANLDNLAWGTYTVQEIKAPAGYTVDGVKQTVIVNENTVGQVQGLTFKDKEILGSVIITKTGKDGAKLAGAEFTITSKDVKDFKPVTKTTDANGVVTFNNLAWGTYKVTETKAPIGYKLDSTSQSVTINAKNVESLKGLIFKDTKILGKLEITKTNESGTEKLQGATFTVTGPSYPKGTKVTTSKNGVANLDNLAWGTYIVQETGAPAGYKVDGVKQTVQITSASVGQVQGLTFKDQQILGSLTITKTGKDGAKLTGATFEINGPSGKLQATTNKDGVATFNNLKWGTYTITETVAPKGYEVKTDIPSVTINGTNVATTQSITVVDGQKTGSLQVTKEGPNGEKLSGAEFQITGPDKFNQTVKTGDGGTVTVNGLAWGKYTIKEIKAPQGYNLSKKLKEVIVDSSNVQTLQKVTMVDTQKVGSLTVTKEGENGVKLKGAEFTITSKDAKDFKPVTKTTDANGVVTFNNLAWGTYKVTETKAPIGYKLDSTSQTVTINAKNVESLKGLIFKDTRILGKLEITKTNESGTEKLQGATFTVTGPSYLRGTKVTTDKNGVANLDNLAWGTYTIKETVAPKGYNLSNEVRQVNVTKYSVGQVQRETFKDSATTGILYLSKVDATTGQNVAGAKINIIGQTLTGEKINITFVSGTSSTKFDLLAGVYEYREINPPVGYMLNTTVGKFEITKQGQIVKANIKDNRDLGKLQIIKTNATGNKKLTGANFEVIGQNGFKKIIQTNAQGLATLNNLPWGEYSVREIKAPKGYKLNYEVFKFNINQYNVEETKQIYVRDNSIAINKLIEENDESPKTGDASEVPFVILGSASLLGFLLLNRKRIMRSKN